MSFAGAKLLNALCLVEMDSVILDMAVECRKRGIDIRNANSHLGEFLGGLELGNAHGKKGFGSDRAHKPNALLGLSSWMDQDIIKIRDLGSPGIHESKTRLLPSGIKAEGAQAFLEFRGSKKSSRGFTIAMDHARVNSSGITGGRMNANENKAIRSSDGVFKNTESISLLLSKEGNLE